MIISLLLLCFALSLDAFAASLAYGTSKIKIPFSSGAIIALISGTTLALSLTIAKFISPYLNFEVTRWICFSILLLIALTKLFTTAMKAFVKWLKKGRQVKIKAFDITFLFSVCEDCTTADKDLSHNLSAVEAIVLGVSLSIDGFAAGFGAGLDGINPIFAMLTAFCMTLFAIYGGDLLGNKATSFKKLDISFIGGLILLLLAFSKIL